MGYSVTLQPYTDGQGRTGHNVAAVKAASVPDADILVLSAHHDSVPTAYGANDNASGVAALLYTAEALRNVPTDTEVRFLSFTDEENGKNGSRTYTASLTEEERTRIVGAIQFDMLGGLGSTGTLVCTVDGEANWVSDLLQKKNPGLESGVETASDHTSFQLSGIPAVLLMQRGGATCTTRRRIRRNSWICMPLRLPLTAQQPRRRRSARPIPSYRALAREQGERSAYRQTRQNMIYFGSSRADTEAYIGAAGEPVGASEISGEGWTDTYETYHYSMRWFDSKVPMSTYYQYRNGFLERIELRPEETGYTGNRYGNSLRRCMAPRIRGGGQTGWSDPIYSKYITLSRDEEGCLVTVGNYSVGITNVLASYPVSGGQAVISDPEDAAVWNYLCSILPLEARQKLAEFNLFTDGTSNVLAYTSPIREEGVTDNTRFSISIDYFDVYDENGEKRDWSKLTYTILHEYGHVLLEDETQIDLTVGRDTHDPAGFVEGPSAERFTMRFGGSLESAAQVITTDRLLTM
ncbi:M20/M25/M40 family metallo-hydrolase [Flavonifractor plautii]|nr:M20/M25/M40 family metallo-hydrolase [Flavonifractor plautii]